MVSISELYPSRFTLDASAFRLAETIGGSVGGGAFALIVLALLVFIIFAITLRRKRAVKKADLVRKQKRNICRLKSNL